MNSWGSDRLEERIEEMLTSSVSPGSEPAGFTVRLTVKKPVFPWMKVIYILTAAVIVGFFALKWAAGTDLTGLEGLLDPRSSSPEAPENLVAAAAILIGLGGTMVAFLSDRSRALHRML